MQVPLRVLCLKTSDAEVQQISTELASYGLAPSCHRVTVLDEFKRLLTDEQWDVVLSDYSFGNFDIRRVLTCRDSVKSSVPVIIVSDPVGDERVAAAMRSGAADFVIMGNWKGLALAVQRVRRPASVQTQSSADDGGLTQAGMARELEKRAQEMHRLNVMLRDEIAIRRQIEDSVRESERRFRTMADGTPVIIWVTDTKGSVQFVNRAYCEFFGVTEDKVKSGQWQMLVHPDDKNVYLDRFFESQRTQTSFHAIGRVRRYDGTWRWIESFGEPRFSSNHEFLGMAGSSTDITERRHAERELANYVKNLEFLSASATELLEPMSAATLYPYVARLLRSVSGRSVVIVSEYDASSNHTIVRAVDGPAEKTTRAERLFEGKLIGLALPVAEGTTERMQSGNLTHVEGGLHDLSFFQIPQSICSQIEEELSLGDIYAMPFVLEGDFLGTVAILTDRNEGLVNRGVIEACVNQAGLALKRHRIEGNLKTLHDASLNGMYIYDQRSHRNSYINPAYTHITGYTVADLQALSPAGMEELFHPDDRPNVAQHIQDVMSASEGTVLEIEYRFRTKDGRWIWCLSRDRVFARDHTGTPFQMIGTFIDITERKKAEEALSAANQRLETHLSNSPLAIVEFDSTFAIIRWSPEAEHMFGWSAAEVMGRRIGDFRWVHEDDVERVARLSTDMLAEAQARNVHENRNYRKDGTIIHCEWYNSAIRGADGSLLSVFSQVLDITERKRVEQALRENEEKFRAFVHESLDGVVIIDAQGRITEWNYGEELITGIPSAEAIGEFMWNVQYRLAPSGKKTPEFLATARERILKGVEEGTRLRRVQEEEIERPNGERRITQSVFFPIKVGQEMMVGAITRDTTQQRQAGKIPVEGLPQTDANRSEQRLDR